MSVSTLDQWVMAKRSLFLDFYEEWRASSALHPDAYPLVKSEEEWEMAFAEWLGDLKLRGGV
jgi:hypothetical protein